MESLSSSGGISQLAQTLQKRMYEVSQKPPVLDFGTIGADMSLLLSDFKNQSRRGNIWFAAS